MTHELAPPASAAALHPSELALERHALADRKSVV
jgi:hypothetical protein